MFDVSTIGDSTHWYDIQVLGTRVNMGALIFFTAAMIRVLRSARSPLPHDLADLKAQIIAAVKNIDAPLLTCVWQELEHRIDECCDTHGVHIKHL
jgi:hypothetical protein